MFRYRARLQELFNSSVDLLESARPDLSAWREDEKFVETTYNPHYDELRKVSLCPTGDGCRGSHLRCLGVLSLSDASVCGGGGISPGTALKPALPNIEAISGFSLEVDIVLCRCAVAELTRPTTECKMA